MTNSLSPAQVTLLKGGNSTTPTDTVIRFILCNGWAAATMRQYAAAVNRYLRFTSTLKDTVTPLLPSSAQTIYHFILWCSTSSSKTVSTNTIKRYLTGLRMWHTLHDQPFPVVNPHRIRILLKACSKLEVKPERRVRIGLSLQDILNLSDRLTRGNNVDLVMKAILLVGFWGLGRLGELTLHRDHPLTFLRRKDFSFGADGRSANLRLRLAKTASPGESQFLRLKSQPNLLDPVNILHEVLRKIPGRANDPLFPGETTSVPMEQQLVVNFLRCNGPQDESMWGGHSLRVGGASFQYNVGRPLNSLKRLGRWKSSAYKLYIHRYTPSLKAQTTSLSAKLHF